MTTPDPGQPPTRYATLKGHFDRLDGTPATGLVRAGLHNPVALTSTHSVFTTQKVEADLVNGDFESRIVVQQPALSEVPVLELHILLDGTEPRYQLHELILDDEDSEVWVDELPTLQAPPSWFQFSDLRDVRLRPTEFDTVLIRSGRDGIVRNVNADEWAAGGRQSAKWIQSLPASQWLMYFDLPFIPAGVRVTSLDGQRRLYPSRVELPAPGRALLEFDTAAVSGIAYFS